MLYFYAECRMQPSHTHTHMQHIVYYTASFCEYFACKIGLNLYPVQELAGARFFFFGFFPVLLIYLIWIDCLTFVFQYMGVHIACLYELFMSVQMLTESHTYPGFGYLNNFNLAVIIEIDPQFRLDIPFKMVEWSNRY